MYSNILLIKMLFDTIISTDTSIVLAAESTNNHPKIIGPNPWCLSRGTRG